MRPLIDFIQVDSVTPRPMGTGAAPPMLRVLSHDPETGGMTVFVEFPPGWERPAGGYETADEEMFMLSGTFEEPDQVYSKYSYRFRPAGEYRPAARCPNGATALVFLDQRPLGAPSDGHGPMYDPTRSIAHRNLADMPWEPVRTPNFPGGAARKTLRSEPARGEYCWVLGLLPHWKWNVTEDHAFLEEHYILEGSIETPVGEMTPGAYLCHPPHAAHGPMRSRRGCLTIARAIGPWESVFTPTEWDFAFPRE
ncbi:MAG: DUF4437 domain-containing protein [Dehalococcoidia bacterium]|nr:DUF4437 domain-containing protein [Dehalococcoidia bacterium]